MTDMIESDPKWMHKVSNKEHKGVLYWYWRKRHNEAVKIWYKYYGVPGVKSGKAIATGQAADFKFASISKAVEKQTTRPMATTDLSKPV